MEKKEKILFIIIAILVLIIIIIMANQSSVEVLDNSSKYVLECWRATDIDSMSACNYINNAINK